MNWTSTIARLLVIILTVAIGLTACRKTDIRSSLNPITAGNPSNGGSVNPPNGGGNGNPPGDNTKGSFPIYTRDGDTLGYFKIHGDSSGIAIVTLEKLPSWMFSTGNSYDVTFYDGPTYLDVYSHLNKLSSDTTTWRTYPVKEHATGKIVRADSLLKMSGLELSIIAPSEVIGIGTIK